MADVTRRMLALLSSLQTGRAFGGAELAARLGTSPRTLRRDVDRLRAYGYPVRTRPGPGGSYRMAAGATLPPLMLDDDEAVAVLLGLATLAAPGSAGPDAAGSVDAAATRAYGKIDQLLPKRLRHRVARLRSALETATVRAPSTATADLLELADAIAGHREVRFDYRSGTGAATARRVQPYRQIHRQQRWYLLAWDLDRSDWRVFRVDRTSGLRVTTSSFAPRPLPADTAVEYLRRGLDRDRERVVLVVAAPLPRVADALRHGDAELRALPDGRTEAVLRLDDWRRLVPILAFLGADATVVAPEPYRASVAAFSDRLRAATAPDGP